MKVSELRKITDALSRFATTRETAKPPSSLIGIQARKEIDEVKFISGDSVAAAVVAPPVGADGVHIISDGRFAISSRGLLQAAKVLPARDEVTLEVGEDKFSIIASGGGRLEFDAVCALSQVGFPRKPKEFKARGRISQEEFKRIAKVFKEISAKVEVPSVQIIDKTGFATAVAPGNRSRYATFRFDAEGEDRYNMSAYLDFWASLTHMTDDGELMWGPKGVLARSGRMEFFSAPYLISKYDSRTRTAEPPRETAPWPIMQIKGELDVGVTIERRKLVDLVKSQAPYDEHNRVTLKVDAGSLVVTSFGSETGLEIPVETSGKGIRSVRADYLTGLLSNMDAREVALRWGSGVPAISLSAEGYESWTLLIAPVAL